MRIRPHLAVVLATVVLGATAGCGGPSPDHDATSGTPDATPVLIDVDPYGAIVLDPRGQYVGVTREGTVAWREPAGARRFGQVSCLARCPDAVLSASLDAINSVTVADPQPQLVTGGQWRSLDSVAGHKRRILSATNAENLVLAVGDSAPWRLEVHQAGMPVTRTPVDGFNATWNESGNGQHALAITSSQEGNLAHWFARTDTGWRPDGTPTPVAAVQACVAPDGSRALLLGRHPVVIDRQGGQQPWTDLEMAGVCAWGASGGIVAELVRTTSGARSRLRAFDAAGVVNWRLDVAEEASVTADPTRSRVATRIGRVLHEIDPASGFELRTITGVLAARYDSRGDLVTVIDTGAVTWRR